MFDARRSPRSFPGAVLWFRVTNVSANLPTERCRIGHVSYAVHAPGRASHGRATAVSGQRRASGRRTQDTTPPDSGSVRRGASSSLTTKTRRPGHRRTVTTAWSVVPPETKGCKGDGVTLAVWLSDTPSFQVEPDRTTRIRAVETGLVVSLVPIVVYCNTIDTTVTEQRTGSPGQGTPPPPCFNWNGWRGVGGWEGGVRSRV